MRRHSKKFQAEWMASDRKPNRKIKRRIEGSFRWERFRDVIKELENICEEKQEESKEERSSRDDRASE